MVEVNFETDISAIPDEILLEIFKWLPFGHLHSNLKLVCRTWCRLISAHYRCPQTLLISNTDRILRIKHRVAAYSRRILALKILDAFDPSVITCLKEHQWPNLRTLIVQSTWLNFGPRGAPLNVADLNHVIDSSPKLRSLKIHESLITGDLKSLIEKIERRKITKLAWLNRYFVTDNIECLYDLKDMKVFRVYCHSFTRDNMPAILDKFLANNQRTITDLGLYMDTNTEWPDGDDTLLKKVVSSCRHLTKLTLAGQLKVSAPRLAQVVDGLPQLRKLRIDVCSTLSSRSLAPFLHDKCSGRLHSLKVAWYRRATSNELEGLRQCCQYLSKLSLELWMDDDEDFVPEVVASLAKLQTSRLRELKFSFLNIGSLPTLASLTSSAHVKFVLELTGAVREGRKTVEAYAKSIESPDFTYEYSFGQTRFTIARSRREHSCIIEDTQS